MQVTGGRDDHRQSEYNRQGRSQSHDRKEAPLHDSEALEADCISRNSVVDEQAWEIEESREPGHDENDMEGLEPEHATLRVCRSYGANTSGRSRCPKNGWPIWAVGHFSNGLGYHGDPQLAAIGATLVVYCAYQERTGPAWSPCHRCVGS